MSDTLTLENLNLSSNELFEERQAANGFFVEWFADLQKEAWHKFHELPMPKRTNEKWRFANIRFLDELDSYEPTAFEAVDLPEIESKSLRFENVSGRLIFVDDNIAAPRTMNRELEDKGVIFTTLLDAVARYPELVKEYLMQQSPELGSEKFEALHVAMLRNGTFLYVPDNVEIEHPFVVYNWAQKDKGAIFPHTLFVTGKHAKASLIEFQECVSEGTQHLAIANAHLFAGEGSQPNHTIIQNWNLNTLSFQLNTNNAQANTNSKSVSINVGSRQARQEIHGKIFGSGSNVELYALNVPKGNQEFDQRTLQSHIAPHSRSDLLFKNALMDKSRTIFSGLIIVEDDAQQTDAYQTNNNLMISNEAEANSLPGLEIKANDVKCSHGSTTGKIDDSELFYFLARGIPKRKAQELMVYGYFEEILEKLGNDALRDYVRELVQHKFSD